HLKMSLVRRQRQGARRKLYMRAPQYAVQSFVRKDRGVSLDLIRQTLAFALALRATHFKNICEVRIKLNEDRNTNRLTAVIQQANVLVTAGLSEELQAESMDGAAGQALVAVQRAVNIRKVNGQKGVV